MIVGLFIGGLLPYLFAAFSMEAVGRPAARWWRRCGASSARCPGIMEGTGSPNTRAAVDIVTASRHNAR